MSERLPVRFAINFEQTTTGWRATCGDVSVSSQGTLGLLRVFTSILTRLARLRASASPRRPPPMEARKGKGGGR
ncbi:hypothetical protein GCM10012319_31520 [Comamonas sp. KCTC 72670]|nr:hypothetical protein GCM10012319_31520 [Comamonas sp. KCTC 72670]